MRHQRSHTTALLFLTVLIAATVSAGSIKVVVSGGTEKIESYEAGELTYFSFSALAGMLGGTLDWEMIGHRINYVEDTSRFEFVINSPFFRINDSTYNLTFPAEFKDGQLFLPAETFLPFLDRVIQQKITWNRESESIRIDSEYFNVVDLSLSPKANGLLIDIHLTQALAYEVFVTEGNWINVSIRDGKINAARIRSRENKRYMYRLKTHQAEGSGQVSIRLRRNVEKWHHKLVYDPPRIQISIADVDFQLDTNETGSTIGPDNLVDVIVVDAGHGGSDYGAVGRGGTREKDVTLSIAKELARLIRKDKLFKVVMTRDRDKGLSLQQRADIANSASADLFISIHANSSTKRQVRGWNVFFLAEAKNDSARAVAQLENSVYLREENPLQTHREGSDFNADEDPILSIINEMIMTEFQAESYDFALMVDRQLRRTLKIPARGVDQAGFFVLNMVFTPSVLVESGFISNSQEEKLLKNKKYQKTVAEAIYKALKSFKAKYEG